MSFRASCIWGFCDSESSADYSIGFYIMQVFSHLVKSERGRRGIPPPHPLLPRPSEYRISPRHTAQKLLGQNYERKTPFPFSKEISPPPKQKCKECFFFRGFRRVREAVWRGVRRAYDLGQSHHALR